MKVVILAGGFGTRLSEETELKPKPMVEIGGMPILWHIMKFYSHYGFNEFVICLGYKGYIIKEFFKNYFLHKTDVTIEIENNSLIQHNSDIEPWKVTLVDTGKDSMTGGRIKRIKKYIGNDAFMLTYGDGVSNIDLNMLLKCHRENNSICTLSSVQPEARFGALEINSDNKITSFQEKPKGDGIWINGGFMVMEPEIFNFIDNDETILESDTLPKLAEKGKLSCYKHGGFWKPMDTRRDMLKLNELWINNNAEWKLWE
jgi:glucose-1-phosphate cytidylyltransferase